MAPTGSGGPLRLLPLGKLQEARFGWGCFLPSFCGPDRECWHWVMIAGGPVGRTSPYTALRRACRSEPWLPGVCCRPALGEIPLMVVPELAGPTPSPGPCCRSVVVVAKARRHCRNWPHRTDSPRAGCPARGSRWIFTFFKRILSENINCRLTTQKRPL